MKYHVVVTGSRPEKKGRTFEPMPEANIQFIESILKKLDAGSYAALYHGMAKGVDTVVDDYAFRNNIRVRQFPAYWFDPTKEGNVDKRAGLFRNEQMIRAALDAVHNKPDEAVVVLGFYNTPNLTDSTGTAHCITFAQKKLPATSIHTYQMPVLKGVTAVTPQDANPF